MTTSKIPFWFLLTVLLSLPAKAQNLLPSQAQPAAGKKPVEAAAIDPLGRSTPRGTVMGFLQAAQSGHYKSATQYFESIKSRYPMDEEQIAQHRKVLMDRAYVGSLSRLSDHPEGTPQEGLPPNEERVGRLVVGQSDSDVILVRVNDSDYGQIWLFSSRTLGDVAGLYDQIGIQSIESKIPKTLAENFWLGMPLWQWLALLVLIPVATVCAWMLIQILGLIGALFAYARKRSLVYKFRPAVSAPLLVILAAVIHSIFVYKNLKIPLLHRHYYGLAIKVVLILGFTWLTA
jgi:MscS family membrane protein